MRFFLWMLLLVPGTSSSPWAQTPSTVQWQRRFGNRLDDETAFNFLYTSRHRLVVGGNFYPANNSNYRASALWLLNVRGDSLGQTLYSYRMASGLVWSYEIRTVAEATNGDLMMAGVRTVPNRPSWQPENVLLRTDSLGTLKWIQAYPGNAYGASTLQPLPDNGALLVTHLLHPLSTQFYPVPVPIIIRVDSVGTALWQRNYGVPYNLLEAITPLADGSYALAGGKSTGPPIWQVGGWILRINVSGDTLRSRVLGGPLSVFKSVAAAPGGGLVLGGFFDRNNALVMVSDSLDRPHWQQQIGTPVANASPSLSFVRALQQPGQVLVGGVRTLVRYGPSNYLAAWQAPTGAGALPVPVWEQQHPQLFQSFSKALLVPSGPGGLLGVAQYSLYGSQAYDLRITRFANVPTLYQVPYCQRPPAAYFAAIATGPAAVQVLDASSAGPRHAQLLVYRWAWGDGTASAGPAPGPHTYATPPPPGTPVTLTVTNNLGCTGTYTAYPFGNPTAAQASRALGAALELYPNPTAGRVALRQGGLGAQGPAALALLDALGRVVMTAATPVAGGALAAELDLRGLPPGLYLLRVSTREGTATRRLVRE